MMKSFLVITILFMIVNSSLWAQEATVAGKLVYVELGGPGVIMSANFDSRFQSNARVGFGYRIGVGYGVEKFEDKLLETLNEDDLIPYLFTGVHLFIATFRTSADLNKGKIRSFYSVPIGLNYIFGKPNKASTFELGAGVTLLTNKVTLYNYEFEKRGHVIGHLNVMYRLAPVNSGLSYRAGFTPIIGTAGDFFPMGAICFGYAF